MDIKDIWIGIGGLVVYLLVSLGSTYGAYRYGRFAERRLLTEIFIQQTKDTYYEGYDDGAKKGKAEGLKSCDDVLKIIDSEDR